VSPHPPRDPLVEIEVGIRGDTAVSLGHAGRKLKEALRALAQARSERQLHRTADALWCYVVQREAMGLTDHSRLDEAFGLTPEVWRRMGVRD